MTENTRSLKERISEKYPEGLTGVVALGGTRTSYILSQRRSSENPGKIDDFDHYIKASTDSWWQVVNTFFDQGVQNLVAALGSYQGLYERGPEYGLLLMKYLLTLTNEETQAYYRANEIDPYFVGIDTLLLLPEDDPLHEYGRKFADFQASWEPEEGRRKVIWEIAPIPLYSFWNARDVMPPEETQRLEAFLASADNLKDVHDRVYAYYARAVYGTYLPVPDFYVASSRNGDLKFRAMLPLSMICGGPFRMFFTPYPSLFMTEEAIVHLLEDLVTDTPGRSFKMDYDGRLNQEQVEQEYQRVLALASDPETTVGLHYK